MSEIGKEGGKEGETEGQRTRKGQESETETERGRGGDEVGSQLPHLAQILVAQAVAKQQFGGVHVAHGWRAGMAGDGRRSEKAPESIAIRGTSLKSIA